MKKHEGCEIERGLIKAQRSVPKLTAEMKGDLETPGVSFIVSASQVEGTFKSDEGPAIKRQRNEWRKK